VNVAARASGLQLVTKFSVSCSRFSNRDHLPIIAVKQLFHGLPRLVLAWCGCRQFSFPKSIWFQAVSHELGSWVGLTMPIGWRDNSGRDLNRLVPFDDAINTTFS